MTKSSLTAILFWAIACTATPSVAETYAVPGGASGRKLNIVRHYEFAVQKGQPAVAIVSGLMSFWGATNWQVVTSSKFKCSEPPSKVETIADDLGAVRRSYRVTWDAPKADKITMDQALAVELTALGRLYTAAKLPYPEEVGKRFAASLGKDEKEKINPDNPSLEPICAQIVKRQQRAESAVEGVCDWINENIKFKSGTSERGTDEALTLKEGSCSAMSRIACSMLRRMGIPAEMITAKFIGSEGAHAFIEVYLPDAGWVFYDLSNGSRGFKSLDCLLTVGWGYRAGPPQRPNWIEGNFCAEKDAAPFVESEKLTRLLRKTPTGMKVAAVTVMTGKAPASVKPRQRPLRELMLDTSVPTGVREYGDDALESAAEKKE
jgi:hypothetical protein